MIQGARIERQGGEHFCINREETARNEQSRDPRSRKPIYPSVYQDILQHGDHVHWAGSKGPHAANARSDAVGGGHAHAGLMCYLGASWPEEYRGKLFIGNIHGQRLNMDVPEHQGSGYVGKHGKDFLNFNDTWSQTLNQLYDQDGSVYVIDWYDKNQCHHTREDGHDRSNGRIYKIVYNDQKTTKVDLQKLSDEELVKLVPSKNEWMSRHARRVLQEHAAAGTLGLTAKKSIWDGVEIKFKATLAKDSPLAQTRFQLRYLFASHCVGTLPQSLLPERALLLDRNEYIRAWAIQFLCEDNNADDDAVKEFARLAKEDSSPVVRLYLASALQRLKPEQRWDVLTELVQHAEDASDHNLPLMYWYAAEPCVASEAAKAVALLKQCKIPVVREFIARRLATSSLNTVASRQ